MIIGILQTGHLPAEIRGSLGDYDAHFERLFAGRAFTYRVFDVVDGVFPDGPEAADGWLVTGSRHAVYEDHPWIAPLEVLVREIVAAGRPLVGICFGHQLIAQALGGTVEKYAGGWAAGRRCYRFGDTEVALNAWHQDQVVVPPPGATILAENAFTPVAAMAIGPRVLTVQAHPEFESATVGHLIEARGAALPAEMMATAQAALPQPTDNARVAGWLADVLEGADATAAAGSAPDTPDRRVSA